MLVSSVIGILVTVCLGLFFYGLRCRWQLAYGLVLAVALAVIFLTFYPQTSYLLLNADPPWGGWLLQKSVGVTSGIYVMVRGLDNIDKGLCPSTWPSPKPST
jgi:hypothetical protein